MWVCSALWNSLLMWLCTTQHPSPLLSSGSPLHSPGYGEKIVSALPHFISSGENPWLILDWSMSDVCAKLWQSDVQCSLGPTGYILRWGTAFYYHTSTLCERWGGLFQEPCPQKMDNRVKRTVLSCYPWGMLASEFSLCVCTFCLAAQRPLLGCSWGTTSATFGTPRAGSGVVTAMAEVGAAAKHTSNKAARHPPCTSGRRRCCSLQCAASWAWLHTLQKLQTLAYPQVLVL